MQKANTLKRAILSSLVGVLAIGILSAVPVEAVNSVPAFQIPVVGTTSSGGMFGGTATITGFTSLICDAAHLLSGGGALQQVANDLNQLLQF